VEEDKRHQSQWRSRPPELAVGGSVEEAGGGGRAGARVGVELGAGAYDRWAPEPVEESGGGNGGRVAAGGCGQVGGSGMQVGGGAQLSDDGGQVGRRRAQNRVWVLPAWQVFD
jgi:hypothetical protein